jgi:hypothetical protein
MASATVAINSASEKVNGSKSEFQIEVQNTSPQVAFFTRLQLMNQTGEEVLPAYWADNYITLKPGERQTIRVWLDEKITTPKSVRVTGWNVAAHGRLLVP